MTAPVSNSGIALRLLGLVTFMGAMAWAAVPFYDWFCRTTGFAGTTNVAEQGSDRVLEQVISIRFDANVERDMPWEFKPVETTMEIRIGETGLAFYEAYNPTDRPIAGTASYNVAPDQAGYFFSKIDCFCFEQQVLQPGERVQMPVSFYVDPDMLDDRDARHIRHITLSYTFHETDLPKEQAALSPDENASYN